jgi:hypothetical protein
MIASPIIRERLLGAVSEVAQGFIDEIGFTESGQEDSGQLTIWGDDLFKDMYWEFSRQVLEC